MIVAQRRTVSRTVSIALLCAISLSANAQPGIRPQAIADGLGTKSKATLVVAALTAVAAAIGVGVYFAIRASHSVRGCAVAGPNGLALQQDSDKQVLLLLGATHGITAGDSIKVHGSRKKKVSGVTDRPSFVVEKLDRDYGVCRVQPSQP